MGTLEKLQKSIAEYLMGIGDLRFADISAEDSNLNLSGKAEGMSIKVLSPCPIKVSRYAAGPTFSKVEISVEIKRDQSISSRQPSITTTAEIISRALHHWNPPVESGYGKLSLSESSPWDKSNNSSITVNFNAQSVLQ